MSNFSQFFKQFTESMAGGNNSAAISGLNNCFNLNPKVTFMRLYERNFLFNREFILLDKSFLQAPGEYLMLLNILQNQAKRLLFITNEFKGYSLGQILQGAANLLEKNNAELKYNEKWNVKYANANPDELENERQGAYFSSAGIELQEILMNLYPDLAEVDVKQVNWNEKEAEKFKELFLVNAQFVEIKDTIEKHLFFDWKLEVINEKEIQTTPPENQREGRTEIDFANNLKSRLAFDALDRIAEQELLKGYMESVKRNQPKPREFWKHVPITKEETEWFAEAMLIDIREDIDVEREVMFVKGRYFPGIEDLTEIDADKENKLHLRDAMRVIAFIKGLSKKHLENTYGSYNKGVEYYFNAIPATPEEIEIERLSREFKGNREILAKRIGELQNENVRARQQKIIDGAKSKVKNEDAFIRFNYKKLVKTIQWLHQFDEEFIKRVIDIFVFHPESKTGITRQPFVKIGEDLCWMPYMVAYASFAENILENLVSSDELSIHNLQTKYFEGSLGKVFEKCGYKVIQKKADKIMDHIDGKPIGDYDLLAYKDGILIHMELKLTGTRNGYQERYDWKKDTLFWGVKQLKKGLDCINDKPERIREILNLGEAEEIKEVKQYLISNSYLYDHETIGGFKKLSYFEVNTAVKLMKVMNKKAKDFVNLLDSNGLFGDIDKQMKVFGMMPASVGEYIIWRPGMSLKNVTTAL